MIQRLAIDYILKKLKIKRILKRICRSVRIEWSLTNIHEKLAIEYYDSYKMQDRKNVESETLSSAIQKLKVCCRGIA